MSRLTVVSLAAVVGVMLMASAVNAAVVYTDRSSWEAAVGGAYSEEDFEGALNGDWSVSADNPAAGIQAGIGVLGPDLVWWDRLTEPASGGYTTTWTFDNCLVGFGAYWDPAIPGGPGMSIELYRDGTLVGQIDRYTSGGFWGFTNGGFDTIFLKVGTTSGWAETYEMDNMVYAVPAPGAALLGMIGLGTLAWLRRRLE